jgi:hypothetical protein
MHTMDLKNKISILKQAKQAICSTYNKSQPSLHHHSTTNDEQAKVEQWLRYYLPATDYSLGN